MLLKDMKGSNPADVVEFVKLSGIHDESAFVCWVPFTLMKGDVVIAAIKSRIRKTAHKYGIEVPTRVEHAYQLTTFGKQIQN